MNEEKDDVLNKLNIFHFYWRAVNNIIKFPICFYHSITDRVIRYLCWSTILTRRWSSPMFVKMLQMVLININDRVTSRLILIKTYCVRLSKYFLMLNFLPKTFNIIFNFYFKKFKNLSNLHFFFSKKRRSLTISRIEMSPRFKT